MTPEPSARTLGALLEEKAACAGSASVVHYHGDTMDYSGLFDAARQAARGLLSLGVRRGDRIGVLFGNSPEWLIATLGAATIGATTVPLNTWYRTQELTWTLRVCGISALISVDRLLKADYADIVRGLVPELSEAASDGTIRSARLPALRAVVIAGRRVRGAISWEEFLAASSGSPTDADSVGQRPDPDDPAFILYTSGSTGEPKGILLTHRGIIESGYHIGQRRLVGRDDVVWLGCPLFYGLGATNALPVALTHGASLVLDDTFNATRAIEDMRRHRASVYYGTGNITRAILEDQSFSRHKVSTLERGNAGTSATYKRMTIVELGVGGATPAYGLTEAYGHATGGHPDDPLATKLETDGAALPGVAIRIVDPQTSERMKTGATGRVLLQGRITPGYFGNAPEGSQALRPDGWFDTGDLGSIDHAGRFRFVARLKEVIKRGGISVSPLEVEQLISMHPNVRDAYVVGVPDGAGEQLVVAYVDVRRPMTEREIQEFIKDRAASFKAPSHVIFRSEDRLPRLASGKVAKHVLAEDARRQLGERP